MKAIPGLLMMIVISFSSGSASAQDKESILADTTTQNMFQKKLRWGLSWNQYWGTIKGNSLPQTYFSKPCLGFNFRAEYYPLPFVGFGAGFGLQQRGAGIINPDNSGGSFTHPWEFPLGNPDSTYRERLRFNTLEVPLTLLLRTPKDVIKGVRISGAAGILFTHVTRAKDYFLSVEDGFHVITDVKDSYLINNFGYQFSLGTDINAGESCILQVHLVMTECVRNVYKTAPANGQLRTFGFRVAWLF